MKGIVYIAITTMVLLRVPISSVVVITYFLFCPRAFSILRFLELPFDYMQKSYYIIFSFANFTVMPYQQFSSLVNNYPFSNCYLVLLHLRNFHFFSNSWSFMNVWFGKLNLFYLPTHVLRTSKNFSGIPMFPFLCSLLQLWSVYHDFSFFTALVKKLIKIIIIIINVICPGKHNRFSYTDLLRFSLETYQISQIS